MGKDYLHLVLDNSCYSNINLLHGTSTSNFQFFSIPGCTAPIAPPRTLLHWTESWATVGEWEAVGEGQRQASREWVGEWGVARGPNGVAVGRQQVTGKPLESGAATRQTWHLLAYAAAHQPSSGKSELCP